MSNRKRKRQPGVQPAAIDAEKIQPDHAQPEQPATPIRGFLIDIDGVLCIENQIIRGAIEALEYLRRENIPFLLATNTTRKSRYSLVNNLKRMGFKIEVDQIYSAPYAASRWLHAQKATSVCLLTSGDTHREFKDFRITTAKPDYLVIGDLGEDLTYNKLNQAFRHVMGGAKMLAMQKNRYWRRSDGLSIDTGAIVAALEYATGQTAALVGKPSPAFYEQAVNLLNLPKENVAMIGDDWESDIEGSIAAGLQGIAVKTGKLSDDSPEKHKNAAAIWLDSIGELPDWLSARSDNK